MSCARPQMSARARDETGGIFAADGQSPCTEEDDSHEFSTLEKARQLSEDGSVSASGDIEDEDYMELDLLSTVDGKRTYGGKKYCDFPGQERPPIQKRSSYELTIVNLSYKVGQKTAVSQAHLLPRKTDMIFAKSTELPPVSTDLIHQVNF